MGLMSTRTIRTVSIAVLGMAGIVLSADLTHHENGIEWLHTTDDWGRPWGDACSSFYRRLEMHRELLANQGISPDQVEFAVGTENSLQKVFRPKMWFRGDFSGAVEIAAARGETESFQLVVCPVADKERGITYLSDEQLQGGGSLTDKTVHVSDIAPFVLKHVDSEYEISPGNIEFYRVGYIQTVPAQYPVMHVGDWPDPLLPLEPFEVANPFCQPVWVDVKVPWDAPAGIYAGTIIVKGPHDVHIAVSLNVWDFSLSEKPNTFTMTWSMNDWFMKDGVDCCLAKLGVLLDHRVAPWYVADQHKTDLFQFDRVVKWLWSRGVPIQALSGKPEPELYRHIKDKGWLDRFICIWGDEPHERDYAEYRSRTQQIHMDCPGLSVAMTETPRPDNIGLFDVWIPEPSSQNDQWIQDALQRGDRVWWYFCQLPIHAEYPGPIHANPGMVVDRPAIDHRIPYWLAFQQHIEGVAYWALSSWPSGWEEWPEKPWPVNPLSSFPYSGQHNGNGFICYPGTDGMPWPSIRMKCIRDGMEDHDYLSTLRAKTGEGGSSEIRQLLEVPPELAMGLRYYNKNPAVLLKVRRLLAAAITNLP